MTRRSISDLPEELVLEILSRVPLTSLSSIRSTCKNWNALSKNQVLSEKAARKQLFLGFMIRNTYVCSLRFDLRGIQNNNKGDFVYSSIKSIRILRALEISKAFHCDGLLLCISKGVKYLFVWNPYLGQTKLIEARNSFDQFDRFAIGYDKHRNHKIVRIFGDNQAVLGYEIYSFASDSWKSVDVKPDDWYIWSYQRGVSLKGNTYFAAKKKIDGGKVEEDILLCFDFATETFVPSLPLPFSSDDDAKEDNVTLSCVRDEQLAVLHQRGYSIQIWITKKIDDPTSVVSWNKFTRFQVPVASDPVVGTDGGSLFIDEDQQVAVVFGRYDSDEYDMTTSVFITGPRMTLRAVNIAYIGYVHNFGPKLFAPLVCSSYVPSLVQLQFNQLVKNKDGDQV